MMKVSILEFADVVEVVAALAVDLASKRCGVVMKRLS